MNQTRASIVLLLVVLPLVTSVSPTLGANFECSQELMAGTWGESFEGANLEREGEDIFQPPGPFVFTGLTEIDKTGRAVSSRHTHASPQGPQRPELTDYFDIQTKIEPDCTGRQTLTLRHDLPPDHPFLAVFGLEGGQTVIDLDVVCVNGQQECWAIPTEPAFQVGLVTMKKVEPHDALTPKINRILRRLGLVP